jgi:signal peptidase I
MLVEPFRDVRCSTFYFPSASMENTLQINDRTLVDQVTPKLAGLHRGDIVVFSDPGG